MSNEEIAKVFQEVYNGFWLKHRNTALDRFDAEGWDRLLNEGVALVQKYDGHPLVNHMVFDLINELDTRMINREEKHERDGGSKNMGNLQS